VPVRLNHTIIAARDKDASARCFCALFSLPEPEVAVEHWADPRKSATGINTNHGGRGVYFEDPAGNYLEAITRPYAG
jgi:hypothetical protein